MSAGRDLRIDTLRGLALVGMTVAHVNFTGLARAFPRLGYTGVAEPFVLLAGLMAGTIYWRIAERRPAAEVWSKGLRRAGFLYFVYLGLALSIIALTLGFRLLWPDFVPMRSELIVRDPALALLLTPVFVFQPGFADILPMYIAFLAATPLVVLAARHRRLGLCAASSALLWALAQAGLGDRLFEPLAAHFGSNVPFFDILGWQVVFFAGLVIGIRREAGRTPPVPHPQWLLTLSIAVIAVCFVTSQGWIGGAAKRGDLGWLENRSAFGPLRVLNTAAFVVLLARVATLHTPWLEQRWLALLGAHSLPVFVYSCFVGYLLTPFDHAPEAARISAVAVGVATLTIPAVLHQRWREARVPAQNPRQEARATSPQPTRLTKKPAAPA